MAFLARVLSDRSSEATPLKDKLSLQSKPCKVRATRGKYKL